MTHENVRRSRLRLAIRNRPPAVTRQQKGTSKSHRTNMTSTAATAGSHSEGAHDAGDQVPNADLKGREGLRSQTSSIAHDSLIV